MLTAAIIVSCILSGLLILGIVLAVAGAVFEKPGLFAVAVPSYIVGAFTGTAWVVTLIIWIVERVTA